MALNVVVVCGSLRAQSYNARIAAALPALAPSGMTIVAAPAFGGFPLYNSDLHAGGDFPADVTAWCDALRAADGVIVVSPEFNWSIPAPLKNAIDWASKVPANPIRNKPFAIQSASTGPMGGSRMQYHLRQVLTALDAQVFGKPEIIVAFADKKLDTATGALTDQPTIDIIRQQLAAFAVFIKRVRVA